MSDKKSNDKGRVDTALVRELASILRDTGLSEIEIDHGDMRLRISRTITAAPSSAPAQVVQYTEPLPPPAPSPSTVGGRSATPPQNAVTSPMVGTAYLSPEPGAPAFIKVGDTVTEGQTLMVVEAMKTFNPIAAPRAGKVREILVTDAQPVEFGEALVVLD